MNVMDNELGHTSLKELLNQVALVEEGTIISVSANFASIFEYGQDELIGMSLTDLVAASDRDAFDVRLNMGYAAVDQQVKWRASGIKKDGSHLFFELIGILKMSNDKSLLVISEVTNISEQQREEKLIIEIEERFRIAFNYATVGMALVAINGRFMESNYAICELLGYEETELGELTFQQITHPDDVSKYLENNTRLLIGEVPYYELENRWLHQSGRIVWGFLSVTLVRDESGKPLYFILQLQDITRRKEAEELLRKSDKLSAVGQLAAGVAHEVRNPLTVLKGFVQLLRSSDPKVKEYSKLMLSEVERIETIISEFLMLSKPQDTKFKRTRLDEILYHVIALMDTKAVMNNVQILSDIEASLPEIECDENQLKQVFINMMQNAIEAMPSGGELRIAAMCCDAEEVQIQISDQGCGIPEDRIRRLGEPFYSSKEKGTGLGLMVSYQIIETHNGRIQVKSSEQEGTNFTISLPLSQSIIK
jgi:two-component system sporulation sensor kinase A